MNSKIKTLFKIAIIPVIFAIIATILIFIVGYVQNNESILEYVGKIQNNLWNKFAE